MHEVEMTALLVCREDAQQHHRIGATRHMKTIDYDSVSKVYDEVRTGDPEMVHHILGGITLKPDSRVLDVGCGTGNNTLLLQAATSSRLIGLDISRGMLQKARQKTDRIQLVQSPAESIPFADESFRLVYMTEVLHHIRDTGSALQELHRILEPDGSICIVTQSHQQIEQRMTSRFFPASAKIDKERYPDVSVIEDILAASGFRDVQPISVSFKPVRLGNDYLLTVTGRGYSMLHKISKSDFEWGLKRLRAAYDAGEELIYSAGYTFVWAKK